MPPREATSLAIASNVRRSFASVTATPNSGMKTGVRALTSRRKKVNGCLRVRTVTVVAWAPGATGRGKTKAGETKRWMVIDESLGALRPDPCLVQVVGQRMIQAGAGKMLAGTAVLWACGPEQVACLVDGEGRALREIWQSTPLVGVATSFAEARQMNGPPGDAGALPAVIEGLQGDRYTSVRVGYSLTVPGYPYVLEASKESGVSQVRDLTDEAWATVHPAIPSTPLVASKMSAEDWETVTSLLQQQWAARYEDVKAEAPTAERLAAGEARVIEGTARLGCAPIHFRNVVVVGDGIGYMVSVASADRPLEKVRALRDRVPASLSLRAPEGRLTLVAKGDRFESVMYGFEVRRPGKQWRAPSSRSGPATVLELVREDLSAVAVVRVLEPRTGQSLKQFVAEQANRAADAPGVEEPPAQWAELGGRAALELNYAGNLLGGEPARCTAVYVELGERVFSLILMAKTDADEKARKELEQIRRSVKFTAPGASK